jgi:hypothetical protein
VCILLVQCLTRRPDGATGALGAHGDAGEHAAWGCFRKLALRGPPFAHGTPCSIEHLDAGLPQEMRPTCAPRPLRRLIAPLAHHLVDRGRHLHRFPQRVVMIVATLPTVNLPLDAAGGSVRRARELAVDVLTLFFAQLRTFSMSVSRPVAISSKNLRGKTRCV